MKYLILLLLLVACGPNQNNKALENKTYNFNNIIAFGDSITVGTGAETGFIERISVPTNSTVTNYGVGSSRIESHMPVILSTPIPKGSVVIYLSGMNDVLRGGDAYLPTYLSNLKQAMDYWESQGAEAYVGLTLKITLNGLIFAAISKYPCTAYTPELYSQETVKMYQAGNYKHVHLVDTHESYLPNESTNSKDGIHPNDFGAEEIAQIFLKSFVD